MYRGDENGQVSLSDRFKSMLVHCCYGLWHDGLEVCEVIAIRRHVTRGTRVKEDHALAGLEVFASEKSAIIGRLWLLVLIRFSAYSQELCLVDLSQPIVLVIRTSCVREPHTIRLSTFSICSAGFVLRVSQLAFTMAFPLPLGALTSLSTTFFPAIFSFVTFLLTIVTVAREFLGRARGVSGVLPRARGFLARLRLSSVIVVNKCRHNDIRREV